MTFAVDPNIRCVICTHKYKVSKCIYDGGACVHDKNTDKASGKQSEKNDKTYINQDRELCD